MNWTKFVTPLGTRIYVKKFTHRTRVVLPTAPIFNKSFVTKQEALDYVKQLIEGES